ncbi:MAG TPA: gephyrin-like molybdotransferase Glp [Polyangia bacterium]|nr:gephyrin-like molybdotransferase Glp [Polyangia bacterium]
MLTFEEARARILAGVTRLGSERVPLDGAAGRVLAETIVAIAPLPPFHHSAMDGYALRIADLIGDGPFSFPLGAEESRAGRPAPVLGAGQACRIFTGAALPAGADAVLMQEDVTADGPKIVFGARPKPGAHVRAAGEDLRPGQRALTEGTRLQAGHLSLAASLDRGELMVARRPRVAIVCTGDELRAPGTPGGPASIPESNGVALAALCRQVGGEPRVWPAIGDDLEATAAALERALQDADLLLTVGGVSVGDHDLVRPALERIGVDLDFYKVAIKPGKPLAFGRRAATENSSSRVLGLPGNPASAMTTFLLFAAPLLRLLQGDAAPLPVLLPARLKTPLRHKPGRLEFARAMLERDGRELWAVPLANQASGATTSTGWATALILVPLEAEDLPAGAEVDVLRLGDL